MMSDSGFSEAILIAGIMSVPRSIANMRKVVNGSGIANIMNARKGVISGMLDWMV